jgi:hypothetical protein
MDDVLEVQETPKKLKKHHKNRHNLEAFENDFEQVYNNFCIFKSTIFINLIYSRQSETIAMVWLTCLKCKKRRKS